MSASVTPKYKILVVDDDIDLNTTFALLLEFDGHEVRTAYACEAALLILEKIQFDLIIAEYWLPGMKGDELAALVKQKWPDQPIILTAANIQQFQKEDHLFAGVDCLLNKPFTISQLREAITWVLERHTENQLGALSPVARFSLQEKSEVTRKAPKYNRGP